MSDDQDFMQYDTPRGPLTGVLASVGVAFLIASLGGALCGWMIDQFGRTGAIVVWPLGFLGGCLLQRCPRFEYAGIVISIGLVLSIIVGEILWIQSNIKGAEELSKAISLFPTFLVQYKQSVFVAAIFLVFGILSALRTARQLPV